ncbi:MAG: hypothetical protein ABI665_14630 [Vicinamibacterales bacterium]
MGQPRYDAARNQYIYGAGPDDDTAQLVDGAITHVDGVHALTKAGVGAYTLAAPTADKEGMRILIVSRTAFAHVVTVAGGLGGNAGDDVLTFAKVGDNIELLADGLFWVPVGAPYGVVIS